MAKIFCSKNIRNVKDNGKFWSPFLGNKLLRKRETEQSPEIWLKVKQQKQNHHQISKTETQMEWLLKWKDFWHWCSTQMKKLIWISNRYVYFVIFFSGCLFFVLAEDSNISIAAVDLNKKVKQQQKNELTMNNFGDIKIAIMSVFVIITAAQRIWIFFFFEQSNVQTKKPWTNKICFCFLQTKLKKKK